MTTEERSTGGEGLAAEKRLCFFRHFGFEKHPPAETDGRYDVCDEYHFRQTDCCRLKMSTKYSTESDYDNYASYTYWEATVCTARRHDNQWRSQLLQLMLLLMMQRAWRLSPVTEESAWPWRRIVRIRPWCCSLTDSMSFLFFATWLVGFGTKPPKNQTA